MAENSTPQNEGDTIETISSAADSTQQRQVQLQIDESSAETTYSSTVRIWGSPMGEEVYLDFAGAIRPAGQNAVRLKIDHRVVMTPWAAKRLLAALHQHVARYEQMFGPLEIDPQKRRVGGGTADDATTTSTT